MSTHRSPRTIRASNKTDRSARLTTGRSFVVPSQSVAAVVSPLPTLRSGMRLYLLVLIASFLLIIGLQSTIDVTFLRFVTALFFFAGFTAIAAFITHTRIATILGGRPSVPAIIIALLAGIALWVPGTWLLLLLGQILTSAIGVLPASISAGTTVTNAAVVSVAIIPICEGILFFGFLLASARGIGNRRALLLIAVLFGIFGMFSDKFGMSAFPAYFLLGLVGATLTLWSGSVIPGILVLSGFYVAEPLILDLLIKTLLHGQVGDLFGFGWLIAAALFSFIAFALTRIALVFRRRQELPEPAQPGALWWIPLVIVIILSGTLINAEVTARSINAQQQAAFTPPITSNTAPPIPPAATPNNPTP